MRRKNISFPPPVMSPELSPQHKVKKRSDQANGFKIRRKPRGSNAKGGNDLLRDILFIKEESSGIDKHHGLFDGFDTFCEGNSDVNSSEGDLIPDGEIITYGDKKQSTKREYPNNLVPDVTLETTSASLSTSSSKPSGDYLTANNGEDGNSAEGGIVLLTRQLTTDSSTADMTLSDWEGLATDEED